MDQVQPFRRTLSTSGKKVDDEDSLGKQMEKEYLGRDVLYFGGILDKDRENMNCLPLVSSSV